jgi:hypothetical protein
MKESLDGSVFPPSTMESQEHYIGPDEERISGQNPKVSGPEEILRFVGGMGLSHPRIQDRSFF